jgi:hypothetical protein
MWSKIAPMWPFATASGFIIVNVLLVFMFAYNLGSVLFAIVVAISGLWFSYFLPQK